MDGRVWCRNVVLSAIFLIRFLTVTFPPAERCHKLHTALAAAERVMIIFKQINIFLKRLARHGFIQQPPFRLLNVSEIIFQMLIEELLLANIKLITFKTPVFEERGIRLSFLQAVIQKTYSKVQECSIFC